MESAQLKYTAQCTSCGEIHNLVYRVETFVHFVTQNLAPSGEKQSMQTSLHTLDLPLLLQRVHKHIQERHVI